MYRSNWISTIFLGCRSNQGLKWGMENRVFWSEIGTGLEQRGGGHTPTTNSQEHPCKYSTSAAYHIYKCLKMCSWMDSFQRLLVSIVRFYSSEPASSCIVFCNFIRGVDQGFVCYFADVDTTRLILFNEKKQFQYKEFSLPTLLLLTPTRRPEDTKFPQEPIMGSWFPLWCELTVCYFFFLSVIPSLIVFFLITFTTNEILPSATLAAEWLTGSTGMSTFRDSFAAVLKRLNWLGMTLLVCNSLVRNEMLRNGTTTVYYRSQPLPPQPPPPKGKKFIPFRLKISFYMRIPNWWLVT